MMESKISEILKTCQTAQQEFFMQILCKTEEERIRNAVIPNREDYLDTLLKNNLGIKPEKFIPYVFSTDH